jgi:hypothetical protein
MKSKTSIRLTSYLSPFLVAGAILQSVLPSNYAISLHGIIIVVALALSMYYYVTDKVANLEWNSTNRLALAGFVYFLILVVIAVMENKFDRTNWGIAATLLILCCTAGANPSENTTKQLKRIENVYIFSLYAYVMLLILSDLLKNSQFLFNDVFPLFDQNSTSFFVFIFLYALLKKEWPLLSLLFLVSILEIRIYFPLTYLIVPIMLILTLLVSSKEHYINVIFRVYIISIFLTFSFFPQLWIKALTTLQSNPNINNLVIRENFFLQYEQSNSGRKLLGAHFTETLGAIYRISGREMLLPFHNDPITSLAVAGVIGFGFYLFLTYAISTRVPKIDSKISVAFRMATKSLLLVGLFNPVLIGSLTTLALITVYFSTNTHVND